jgi:hypothetical protein
MFFRTKGGLVQLLVEPDGTHMHTGPWFPRMVEYTAQYIAAAAQARIPPDQYATTGPVRLIPPNATAGWLTDMNIKPWEPLDDADPRPITPAASFADYTGNRTQTNWHFTPRLAEYWTQLQSIILDRRPQQVPNVSSFGAQVDPAGSVHNISGINNGTGPLTFVAKQGYVACESGSPTPHGPTTNCSVRLNYNDADPFIRTPGFNDAYVVPLTLGVYAAPTPTQRVGLTEWAVPLAPTNNPGSPGHQAQEVLCETVPTQFEDSPPFLLPCRSNASLPVLATAVSGAISVTKEGRDGGLWRVQVHPLPASLNVDCLPALVMATQFGDATHARPARPTFVRFTVCRRR